jgi:membrane-associated protease RseP (regulator of RpoE activity)
MFRIFIAFPVLILVVILQSSVISQITLLKGYGDLMLVVLAAWGLQARIGSPWVWAVLGSMLVGFVSKAPWPILLTGYVFVSLLSHLLQRRVWQAPLLAMFSVTFLGTVVLNLLLYAYFQIFGVSLDFSEAMGLIILPNLLINLLIALPVFYLVRDLSRWVNYSQEDE